MPRVLPNRQRQPGTVTSGSVVANLLSVPVGQDGPDWKTPGTNLRVEIEGEQDSALTYDLAVEANDEITGNESGWYTVIAATGMPAVHTTRDGSVSKPRISYSSTQVGARRLRAVVSWNVRTRFAVDIEVN